MASDFLPVFFFGLQEIGADEPVQLNDGQDNTGGDQDRDGAQDDQRTGFGGNETGDGNSPDLGNDTERREDDR